MITHWLPKDAKLSDIDCLCLGTGRFLRSVLVPALTEAGMHPAMIQPRGRSFMEFLSKQRTITTTSTTTSQQQQSPQGIVDGGAGDNDMTQTPAGAAGAAGATKVSVATTYPVDTVLETGEIVTDDIPCYGAFSLGTAADRQAFYECLPSMHCISIVGVGVTEAGLASADTPIMKELYLLLQTFRDLIVTGQWRFSETIPRHEKICIINTDNVPNNGKLIQSHMMTLAASSSSWQQQQQLPHHQQQTHHTLSHHHHHQDDGTAMQDFLNRRVVFLDSMVDRITSERQGSRGLIPRCEPVPAKALVILDQGGNLPDAFQECYGTSTSSKSINHNTAAGAGTTSNNVGRKKSKSNTTGVVVRTMPAELEIDLALKLRIANATHTAVAHVMALLKLTMTDALSSSSSSPLSSTAPDTTASSLLMNYLDALFEHQILAAGCPPGLPPDSPEAIAVYKDWRKRLTHPHFGLSTFFITQNGAAKGGIRLGPTALDLMRQGSILSVTMAYAFAALLRWMTPGSSTAAALVPLGSGSGVDMTAAGVYRGWLQQSKLASLADRPLSDATTEYADHLHYNLGENWYEFKCACKVSVGTGQVVKPVAEWLGQFDGIPQQPVRYNDIIRAYLLAPDGGNLGPAAEWQEFDHLVHAVSLLYARMVAGDDLLKMLLEMRDCQGPYHKGMATECSVLNDCPVTKHSCPLYYRIQPIPDDSMLLKLRLDSDDVAAVVASEVASVVAVDLHTHLLPPSHGPLCLWGIDELLTYHYLVAEYFMTAPASITPDIFYAKSKKEQADLIWKALFVDRTPLSEACRGVITTLITLGLTREVKNRDLQGIREFYARFREEGAEGVEKLSNMVHKLAGVRYNVMTNIPFDSNEAQYWRPERKQYSEHYRSALRVDPLLTGDKTTIENALAASGYDRTLEGARQYLRDWCDTIKPEYLMASTPHDFVLKDGGSLAGYENMASLNEQAMNEPGAFAAASSGGIGCSGAADESPTVIDENSDFVSEVLMKVCEERDLPLALKIGAHRGVNPTLRAAGDGMVAFADATMLGRLCARYPKVRFLATFLSRNNQHDACVLASKFRNLHIYGCWWYCNNPSIIKEITEMRMELLGTAFTAQHSDARVLDQLLYKWPHSRTVIAAVMTEQVSKLCASGWSSLRRQELRRDVARLFGKSYEDFMAKSLA